VVLKDSRWPTRLGSARIGGRSDSYFLALTPG
jgi:hypothetical protein